MELVDYRKELVSKVQGKAVVDDLLDQEAFFHVACEMLRDSEAITDYQPIDPGYRFGEGTSHFMAVDGYDQSSFEMDESIVLIACDDYSHRAGDEQVTTIQAKACMRYFKAMRNYIRSALQGSFLEQAEESSTAWELAQFINEHQRGIARFRLYFVTDREYTGRDSSIKDPTDFYSKGQDERKISLEAHVWDLRHLMEASQAAAPLEHLSVSLGDDGIPAVKAPDVGNGMDTYLMFLSGQTLSDWYKKHGSKLMEANVRSFLSLRGKVNRGIRDTLRNEPDRFVAYNNGLSATASTVVRNTQGNITEIHDLQIVNGGQTTASIFYSKKKDSHLDLSNVMVPVKLVVVHEDIAREIVPYISRYTNSQNKVAETDFSSNSEYQVKLSQLSQQVLTPPLPGRNPTHWYYERTRGQYDSEKNRRTATERKQFEKLNPSRQRIKMIDAPKYLMCWDGYPHIASLGSQKCFARFVEAESQKGDASVKALDTEFFKQLVCKRIIFDTVYRHIKTADWYRGAYQGNIAEYAMAKYALDLNRFRHDFIFENIWRTQRVNDTVFGCLMKAAEQASDVLNDPNRSTQNVSEWAKKEDCWTMLRRKPSCLDAQPTPNTMPLPRAQSSVEAPQTTTYMAITPISNSTDDAFGPTTKTSQTTAATTANKPFAVHINDWLTVSPAFLHALHDFASEHHLLSPKSESSLQLLANNTTAGININALNNLLSVAYKCGFIYETSDTADAASEDTAPSTQKAQVNTPDNPIPPLSRQNNHVSPIEQDIDYQRDFLTAINANDWRIILMWTSNRHLLSDDILGLISKIDKHIRLTDAQTKALWEWRKKVIKTGFSSSQFAPRSSTN